MKHTLVALLGALTVSAMPTMVQAQDASPLTFNVSVTTDYRYRGISQTRLKPALQGGADYDLGNGFYIGTWPRRSSGSRTVAATATSKSTSMAVTRPS